MKGIVNSNLIDRCKGSNGNPLNPSLYKSGDEVEIIDIVNGDEYNGNKVWYKLNDGNYVWSGGIEGVEDVYSLQDEELMALENYNDSFKQIPIAYRKTKGKDIKVAVLDSGINLEHLALKGAIKEYVNSSNSAFNITDKTGHGTHCAGIIGARNHNLVGIAPNCNLFISKVISDRDNYLTSNFIKGLEWAINTVNADVINISIGLDIEINNEIVNLLEEAVSRNIIVVASAGENSLITKSFAKFWYPAMYEQCIAIGAVSKVFHENNSNLSFNDSLDFIMPYNLIKSCGKNNSEYFDDRGSSMASAFISGIACLIKANASDPNTVGLKIVKDAINSFALKFQNTVDLNKNLQIFKK